jgi:hypothetical protein
VEDAKLSLQDDTSTQNEERKRVFEELKDKLCTAPTLAFPDFEPPFILYVDGSKERGFGAAIHQLGTDDIERPISTQDLRISEALLIAWKH